MGELLMGASATLDVWDDVLKFYVVPLVIGAGLFMAFIAAIMR